MAGTGGPAQWPDAKSTLASGRFSRLKFATLTPGVESVKR